MLEPSAASDLPSDLDSHGEEPSLEVTRLEAMLAARSRERRDLHGELARTTALLREAISRFAELPAASAPAPLAAAPSREDDDTLSRLRAERDAAVAQALEAEARAAETAFRLDEALGHLLAGQRAQSDEAALQGTVRGLAARAAETEEALATAEARLLLGEEDLRDAKERSRRLERELQEASERFELTLMQAQSNAQAELARAEQREGAARTALAELRGERDGQRARAEECEHALAAAQTRRTRAELQLAEAAGKLAEARAEYAEQQLLAQAQAAEFAMRVAGPAERADTLRRALEEVRPPLSDFAAAVKDVVQGRLDVSSVPARSELTEEPTMPGIAAPSADLDALERRLEASERRVQELEAMLAGRMTARDPQLSTLKGELIDVRANATRLADDLSKERARRRKLAVTVRALQAASESGEDPAPWLEELIALINEGATVPPPK